MDKGLDDKYENRLRSLYSFVLGWYQSLLAPLASSKLENLLVGPLRFPVSGSLPGGPMPGRQVRKDAA